ncbi:MAG: hypothetical protein UX65_C0011G0010 [Parcubacteria group bacterium GW2011_GWB1_46_8]|nr:MAG: hypothetical protein UV67_C0029G0005 [Parcubacteria group bacterium GW2011_GWC1_43_12]KKU09861.1 MAG: hypothetical protein UX14_C0033G0005 [Parcubacteria group bacterium GW2011_GWF1_45_5]KKU46036.1 MAG: hypothetical protein UX65_C0011G0010 [Parcubacteria group bacterium GW2011_GWB1_46_8]KKU47315.1 MAG: hypothetical protein UX66_C0017G0010 [Parcubacteria group bacterium GW2011_GWF2_46_8]
MLNLLKKFGLNLVIGVAALAVGYAGYFLPVVFNDKGAFYFAGCIVTAFVIYGLFTNKAALWLILVPAIAAFVTGMAVFGANAYQSAPDVGVFKTMVFLFGLIALGFHLALAKDLNGKI